MNALPSTLRQAGEFTPTVTSAQQPPPPRPPAGLVLLRRLHQDFLMRSRLEQWATLLHTAAAAGYRTISVQDLARAVETAADPARPFGDQRVLVLRNDVDTDAATALAMAHEQHRAGAGGSFFFRLSTFDPRVVAAVHAMGFHVSYHFEEIATYAKRMGLIHATEVRRHFPAIADELAANLERLRRRSGLPLDVLASHGDWKNRQLDLSNDELLADPLLRARLGVRWEAYDEPLARPIAFRASDSTLVGRWGPGEPLDALLAGVRPVYLLVHTRYWRANRRENLTDELHRVGDMVRARQPRRR